MTSETPEEPQEPKKPEGKNEADVKQKFNETLDSLRSNEKIETLFTYAKTNTMDTIAYILLILGIVFLFFNPFTGGLMIGVITGIYFSEEIASFVEGYNNFIETAGMVKSLILGGALLALFISAPGIFIGGAIAAGVKHLLAPGQKKEKSEEE